MGIDNNVGLGVDGANIKEVRWRCMKMRDKLRMILYNLNSLCGRNGGQGRALLYSVPASGGFYPGKNGKAVSYKHPQP